MNRNPQKPNRLSLWLILLIAISFGIFGQGCGLSPKPLPPGGNPGAAGAAGALGSAGGAGGSPTGGAGGTVGAAGAGGFAGINGSPDGGVGVDGGTDAGTDGGADSGAGPKPGDKLEPMSKTSDGWGPVIPW